MMSGWMVLACWLAQGSLAPEAPPAGPDAHVGAPSIKAQAPDIHLGPDAATEAYLAQMSPEATARSDAYFEGGYWLILWDFVISLGIAWLLLGTGLSVRMRDVGERITRFKRLQVAIYWVQYLFLTTAIAFPFTVYEGFFREHQYNLSNQTFGQWMGDQVKAFLVTLVLGSLALTTFYAVIRRVTKTWWIWGAGVAVLFLIIGIAITPVYISPLFNDYKSLPSSPLKAQILSLARANGIPVTDVLQFDASKQTKRMSANVSGLFNTTRISMNDNLLNRGSPEEIKAVLGHEMGHYVLNHIYKAILMLSVVAVVAFAFTSLGFSWAQKRWGQRWGIQGVGDVAGLPLLFALGAVFGFVFTPLNNTLIRTQEAEADMFGLNASREPDGFAQAALHLSEYRKMRPGPVEEMIFFDHPSGWNRIHRAMVWKAEQELRSNE